MKTRTVIFGIVLSFALGLVFWAAYSKNFLRQAAPSGSGDARAGAVPVELYVMSQCPFGVQAEATMFDVVSKLGPAVSLSLDYIGTTSPSGELTSMHGTKEVEGDKAQLCAMKYAPTQYRSLILCQNREVRSIDGNWESCASAQGLPVDKMRACIKGDEGAKLLADSFSRSKARGATSSPTIYVGGKAYQGSRRPNDLLRAICAEFKQGAPSSCLSIPESPKVNVTFLSDRRCRDCDVSRYQAMAKNRIANPAIRQLDYSDSEGRRLYEETKPGSLPIAVFDETLDADSEALSSFGRLRSTGRYRVMALGGEWNPVCAGEGGCDQEACKNYLGCRKQEANRLDLFVMSQCPYGVRALDAMKEVLSNFGSQIDFRLHFIGDGTAKTGLKSMHGQAEVDEDLREVCAMKHYPHAKFMQYVWCRNKSLQSPDWRSCAVGDIKPDVIAKCAEGEEGKQLLEAEFAFSKELGIAASPSWIANNRFKFSGADSESIRKQLCDRNRNLKGCEKQLTSTPPAVSSASTCRGS